MDNDDEPIGRVLTRREILALFGATGAALVAGTGRALTGNGNNQTYLSLVHSAPGSQTATATPTGTATSSATATGTSMPTGTATASATGVPSATATGTPPATETATTTATATESATPTASATPTGTASPTSTGTATVVPTATPTVTATPSAQPTCIVRPEQTEGPYFVDERLNRSDIRVDPSDGSIREGVLLYLRFNVTQITPSACTFLQGVYVDVWHCDAAGDYSDIQSEGTLGKKFLRGYQVTNALGAVEFLTIYPGWYSGRTVHIHFKIRTELNNTGYDFTSQLYFDDNLTDKVFLLPPYNERGTRDTRNNNDGIYQNGGAQLLLTCTPDGNGGYIATFNIGLAIS